MRVKMLVLAGLATGILGPVASADDLTEAATRVTECRQITDSTARLSCLDAAALALSEILANDQLTAPTPEAPVASVSVPESAAPEEPDVPKWAKAPEPRKVAPPEQKQVENQVSEEDRAPIWARVLRPDDGSDDELYPVTVVRITRNAKGRIFFYTDSGEIWRQTEVKEVSPPKSLPAGAVVQRSMFGSPRLSFDDVPDRTYRVRRIE